jgi:hypothetical protein
MSDQGFPMQVTYSVYFKRDEQIGVEGNGMDNLILFFINAFPYNGLIAKQRNSKDK